MHCFPKVLPEALYFMRCLTEVVRRALANAGTSSFWDGAGVCDAGHWCAVTGSSISLLVAPADRCHDSCSSRKETSKGRGPSVPAAPRTLSLVGQQVPVQVMFAAEALFTARTLEGLLPGMGQPVSHQVVPPAKALPTLSAHVALWHWGCPLALPSPRVLLIFWALAGLPFCMHSLVAGQMRVAAEILATF